MRSREGNVSRAREGNFSRARVVVGLFAVLLLGCVVAGVLPPLVVALYATLSFITFLVYRRDKLRAKSGEWRIPEKTLHLLGLFGGWPGGLLAREQYRHKTQKVWFRVIFWAGTAVNCGLLAALIYWRKSLWSLFGMDV